MAASKFERDTIETFAFNPSMIELVTSSRLSRNESWNGLQAFSSEPLFFLNRNLPIFGDEMRKIVSSGLEFQRISNATPEMLEVVRRTEQALKVGRYGVKLP
jgi:hypothetical protein